MLITTMAIAKSEYDYNAAILAHGTSDPFAQSEIEFCYLAILANAECNQSVRSNTVVNIINSQRVLAKASMPPHLMHEEVCIGKKSTRYFN
jgi:hypothetical protein